MQSSILELFKNPILFITVLLIVFTIIIYSAVDMSHLVLTSLSLRALTFGNLIFFAWFFNFLGVLLIYFSANKVAKTIENFVKLGEDSNDILMSLLCVMIVVTIWTIASFKLKMPSSKSHAIIAGLLGAALSGGGFSWINGEAFLKFFYGILISTVISFSLGYFVVSIIKKICKNRDRRKTNKFFGNAQILSFAINSFAYGFQSAQKFLGLFLIIRMVKPVSKNPMAAYIFIMVLAMTIGINVVGKNFIKRLALNVVKFENYEGFAAEMVGAVCILASSFLAIPLSTTHTYSVATMGVGASKRLSNVNWSYVKVMAITWFMTFFGCAILAFVLCKIFA